MYRTGTNPHPLVVSAFNGKVAAYDRASGRTVWVWEGERPCKEAHVQPTHVVLTGTQVFVLTVVRDENGGFLSRATVHVAVTALDDATGRVLWSQLVRREQTVYAFAATILVDGGQVMLSHGDLIMAMSAENGQVQWSRASEHADEEVFLQSIELATSEQTSKPIPITPSDARQPN